MTTNVPVPSFTTTGFSIPPESAVLTGVQEDINDAFGGNLNFSTTQGSPTNATPQGQLAASMASIIGNVNDTFLFYSTQTDPAFAEGRMQDAIGRIYFIERIPAQPVLLQVQCIGAVGTLIPVGSLIIDAGNNQYASLATGTIGVSGSVTIEFASLATGSLGVPAVISIYQAISGWDTATIISGTPGTPTENQAQFEQRRALSVAANSIGSLPSLLGTVLSVPGVIQALVTENASGSPQVFGGITLPAHSVYVTAAGGSPQNVAQAIWSKKAPGCVYAGGNTTIVIEDTSPGYSPPFPSYPVTYQIPNPLPLLFSVAIVNSPAVPSNAASLVQQAIINAGQGLPNAQGIIDGPQSAIGAKIWASRFVPSIMSLGAWAQGNVISVNIGSNNDVDAASFVGHCSGTALFVRSLTTGTISAGATLSVSNGSGVIIPGTTIVTQISGAAGGTGVYTISTTNYYSIGNMLPYSNSFNNWLATGCTVMGSAELSPDGTMDAWLWQRTTISGTSNILEPIVKTPAPVEYTLSLYGAPGTGNFLQFYVDDNTAFGSNTLTCNFNIATGVVSVAPQVGGTGTSPFSNFSATVEIAGNNFYRCTLTFTSNGAAALRVAFGASANNSTLNGSDSLSNTTIFMFGAQLDLGPEALPYVPTTSTSVVTSVLGTANPNETSVQVNIDQIPTIAANNIVVAFD